MTTTINTELTIEYEDYDEYEDEPDETTINATITVNGNDWIVRADGWTTSIDDYPDDQPDTIRTWRVIDKLDKILVAPIKQYGPRETQSATYTPGDTRLEPNSLQHDGMYVEALVAPEIADTLGPLVQDAREQYQADRGIRPVEDQDIDVPEITLEVQEGTPMFPSSKTGVSMAPREALVVEPETQTDTYDRWHDAIVETTNRYEVWTGTQHKGTDELLAPPEYDAGDTLTLAEYLDAFYTVNPEVVEDAVVDPDIKAEQETQAQKLERLCAEHPELGQANIKNMDAFEEASNTNGNVLVAESTDKCRDAQRDCTLDTITMYATPDGNIETARNHTY